MGIGGVYSDRPQSLERKCSVFKAIQVVAARRLLKQESNWVNLTASLLILKNLILKEIDHEFLTSLGVKLFKILTKKKCQGHENKWLVVTTYLLVFNVVCHRQITFGNLSIQIQILV